MIQPRKASQVQDQGSCCHWWGRGQCSELPTLSHPVGSNCWDRCFSEDSVPKKGEAHHCRKDHQSMCGQLGAGPSSLPFGIYITEGFRTQLRGHIHLIWNCSFCPFNKYAAAGRSTEALISLLVNWVKKTLPLLRPW